MRSIDTHKAPADTCPLTVHAIGERGPGGDNHLYMIAGADVGNHPVFTGPVPEALRDDPKQGTFIAFQKGNPAAGWNGVTIEALLAICADRLEGCQSGPWACTENEAALLSIKGALDALHDRVRRVATEDAAPAALDSNAGMPTPKPVADSLALGHYADGEPVRVNDVVRLNSGGPEMLVITRTRMVPTELYCVWFTEQGQRLGEAFSAACLALIRRTPVPAVPATQERQADWESNFHAFPVLLVTNDYAQYGEAYGVPGSPVARVELKPPFSITGRRLEITAVPQGVGFFAVVDVSGLGVAVAQALEAHGATVHRVKPNMPPFGSGLSEFRNLYAAAQSLYKLSGGALTGDKALDLCACLAFIEGVTLPELSTRPEVVQTMRGPVVVGDGDTLSFDLKMQVATQAAPTPRTPVADWLHTEADRAAAEGATSAMLVVTTGDEAKGIEAQASHFPGVANLAGLSSAAQEHARLAPADGMSTYTCIHFAGQPPTDVKTGAR